MSIINTQPVEKWVHDPVGTLDVVGLPWLTIQGEGPHSGLPAVFVRLAGCNLKCELCDTIYTTGREHRLPAVLAQMASKLLPCGLVVLTGGEPFRQRLSPFVSTLLGRGHRVQIETNGTFYEKLPDEVTIVCSPKTPSINPELARRADAYKYVVQAGHVDDDGLPSTALGGVRPARPYPGTHCRNIYMQPLDEQDADCNAANMATAVSLCLKHGWRLCLQVHKIAGLP